MDRKSVPCPICVQLSVDHKSVNWEYRISLRSSNGGKLFVFLIRRNLSLHIFGKLQNLAHIVFNRRLSEFRRGKKTAFQVLRGCQKVNGGPKRILRRPENSQVERRGHICLVTENGRCQLRRLSRKTSAHQGDERENKSD
jgi:hypothetical protein